MESDEEKKVSDLEEMLEKERDSYSSKISELFKFISEINRISEAQVLMLSYRHILVDKLTKYRSAIYKKKANDLRFKKTRQEYYKTQYDVRLDYREMSDYINADMALRTRQTELLENQISYYSQCIDTLDRMGWAIKNKIMIEELKYKEEPR